MNVDLEASPTAVCAALERAVRDSDIPNVAGDPPASAVLLEIGPRHGTYALRYFLTNPQVDDPTDSAVRSHVLASLERKGMKLGVPYQEELQIKDNEAHRAAAAAKELEQHRRVVRDCELFATLSDARARPCSPRNWCTRPSCRATPSRARATSPTGST